MYPGGEEEAGPEATETALKSPRRRRRARRGATRRGCAERLSREMKTTTGFLARLRAAFVRRVEASVGGPLAADPGRRVAAARGPTRRRAATRATPSARRGRSRLRPPARSRARAAALALPAPPATSGAGSTAGSGSDAFDEPAAAARGRDEASRRGGPRGGGGGGGARRALGRGGGGARRPSVDLRRRRTRARGSSPRSYAPLRGRRGGPGRDGCGDRGRERGSPSPERRESDETEPGRRRRRRRRRRIGRPNPPGSRRGAHPSPGDASVASRQIPVDAPADLGRRRGASERVSATAASAASHRG